MDKTSSIIINFKSKKSIPIYLFLVGFFIILIIYANQEDATVLDQPWLIGSVVLWMFFSLFHFIEIRKSQDFLHKYRVWINTFVLFLTPITSFFIVEIMVSNYNPEMFQKYSIYNLVWYYAIVFYLYVVIRNTRLTIILSNIVIYLAAVVNYMVYLFRGNPVLPSDLLAWQTGMSVASNYEVSFSQGFILASLIFLMVYVFGSKLAHGDKRISRVNRLIGLGVYGLFVTGVYFTFFQTDLIHTQIRVIDYFAPKYTYSSYGTAFGFVANIEAMATNPPEGYSIEYVEKVFHEIEEGEDEIISASKAEKPNIIAIMNEAYSDLSMIGDYETNLEYLPFMKSLEENATKGSLYVSVFGGATSDTEYEFLTGNSMAVMPQNCVPYQQFITEPTDSLASVLKEQGYYNIAIHPYKPSGYKRDLVYPLLGFDEFLSEEDFDHPKLIRSFISDKESFQKIIEQYETKGKDKPLFIFNVTMQNHGGYGSGQLFPKEDTVRFTKLRNQTKVEQYLSLLRESDKSFQDLVEYFSKEEEPTIILMFGDHQPVVFSDIHNELEHYNKDEIYTKKYEVPFVLWANYDITEDDVDKISANYLSSYLLEAAKLKGSAYQTYLSCMRKQIPVINGLFYMDQKGEFHNLGETNAESSLIKEYKIVGYNNALDKRDRLKEFYQ